MDFATIGAAARDLSFRGDLMEAEVLFRHAIAQQPDADQARTDLAMTLFAQGRFAEGADFYESRLARVQHPALPWPRWRGEPLEGRRVLIWPEQGLGDQIMCARFAVALSASACDVTLICAPPLQRLFRQSLPLRVLPARGQLAFPDPDVWLWTMSLLKAVGVQAIQSAPYLTADHVTAPYRVGVATRGSATNANDACRSLPNHAAAELLALPGAGSLLPEHTGARDMLDTAEIIAGLDLVVSVDTSIAHLAGAMGKPVWILLPAYGTDWRWLREREDTPWYPSARLLRQKTPGDWSALIDQVRRGLSDSLSGRSSILQDGERQALPAFETRKARDQFAG